MSLQRDIRHSLNRGNFRSSARFIMRKLGFRVCPYGRKRTHEAGPVEEDARRQRGIRVGDVARVVGVVHAVVQEVVGRAVAQGGDGSIHDLVDNRRQHFKYASTRQILPKNRSADSGWQAPERLSRIVRIAQSGATAGRPRPRSRSWKRGGAGRDARGPRVFSECLTKVSDSTHPRLLPEAGRRGPRSLEPRITQA